MSKWTHSICKQCYAEKEPGREPVTMRDAEKEKCCFCGRHTKDGIYYRADPKDCLCNGKHEEEQ